MPPWQVGGWYFNNGKVSSHPSLFDPTILASFAPPEITLNKIAKFGEAFKIATDVSVDPVYSCDCNVVEGNQIYT